MARAVAATAEPRRATAQMAARAALRAAIMGPTLLTLVIPATEARAAAALYFGNYLRSAFSAKGEQRAILSTVYAAGPATRAAYLKCQLQYAQYAIVSTYVDRCI